MSDHAYLTSEQLLRFEKMIAQNGNEESVRTRLLTVLPQGFKVQNKCDVQRLRFASASTSSCPVLPPSAILEAPVVQTSADRSVVAYQDLDDPRQGDSLFE